MGNDVRYFVYLFRKKRIDGLDFGARAYSPSLRRWMVPAPLGEKYRGVNLYAYCSGDPVNYVDLLGKEITGATRKDAERVVEDLRSLFIGEDLEKLRNLITQSGKKKNGKSLSKISTESLSLALSGVSLSDDQKALIEIVVNTINSDNIHRIEYLEEQGNISFRAQEAFLPKLLTESNRDLLQTVLDANNGLPAAYLINIGGGGITTTTANGGTYTLIFPSNHPFGRSVTVGHELLGHGRSLALGLFQSNDPNDILQHICAIQTENLILRVLGISYINTGANHGPETIISNATDLPNFR